MKPAKLKQSHEVDTFYWEYRFVPTSGYEEANSTLNSSDQDGWEVVCFSECLPGEVILLLRRSRPANSPEGLTVM